MRTDSEETLWNSSLHFWSLPFCFDFVTIVTVATACTYISLFQVRCKSFRHIFRILETLPAYYLRFTFFCYHELIRFLFGKHDIPGRRRARVASRSHVAHSSAREFRGASVRVHAASYVADTEDGIAQTSRHDTVLAQSLIFACALVFCADRLLLAGNVARPCDELDSVTSIRIFVRCNIRVFREYLLKPVSDALKIEQCELKITSFVQAKVNFNRFVLIGRILISNS